MPVTGSAYRCVYLRDTHKSTFACCYEAYPCSKSDRQTWSSYLDRIRRFSCMWFV